MKYEEPSAEELSLIQRLFAARAAWKPTFERTLIIVHDRDDQTVFAWCSGMGFLTSAETNADLATIAQRHAATRALALNSELFDTLWRAWNGAASFPEALIAAGITLLRAQQSGTLQVWPSVDALTGFSFDLLDRASFGTCWPEAHVMALVLWQGGQVSSSVVVRRHAQSVDVVVGSETLRDWSGHLSGVLRRDSYYIAQAIERELGPLQLGMFVDIDALQKYERKESTDARMAWGAAWQAGDIIVEAKWPWSWMLLALAVFQGLREFAQTQLAPALLDVIKSGAQDFSAVDAQDSANKTRH